MMTDEVNPYNCFQPGNLFSGFTEEILHVTNGFRNGKSFAVLGGAVCGTTSLLLKVEERVSAQGVIGSQAFARVIDLGGEVPHSASEFFAMLYREVVRDCVGAEPWNDAPPTQPYREFLKRLQSAGPAIEQRHGVNWLVVLLIDKLDLAKGQGRLDLENGGHREVFTNLRNLLSVDGLRRHFRLVATGGSDMYRLVGKGSPLVNILEPVWLRPLTGKEADALIAAGGLRLTEAFRHRLFELSGRHPFILQDLLERLWERRDELSEAMLNDAAARFARNRGNLFQKWVDVMGAERCAVYRAIAAGEGKLTVREIRMRSKAEHIDESLRVLSFHGVIDDVEDPDRPIIAGTIFLDWFRRNAEIGTVEIPVARGPKRFAVAFSFAGETRARVGPIATCVALELTKARILYDQFHQAEFAIPDLDTHLQRLYHEESELIVVVICTRYEEKMWTGLEWRAIRNVLNKRDGQSIMFLRTDDGEVEGIFDSDGYLDLRNMTDEQVAGLILERLRLVRGTESGPR